MKDLLDVIKTLVSEILKSPFSSLFFLTVGVCIGAIGMYSISKERSNFNNYAIKMIEIIQSGLGNPIKKLEDVREEYEKLQKKFDQLTIEKKEISTKYNEMEESASQLERNLRIITAQEIKLRERVTELEADLTRSIYIDPAVGPLVTPEPVAITEGSSAAFLNDTLVIGLLAVGKDDTGYFANITISTLREPETSVRNGNHLKLSIRKQDYVVRVDEIMIRSSRRDNFSLPIEEGVVRISIMKL